MRDDHERTRGVMGALLADGAEEQPDESAVSARAEDEQIGIARGFQERDSWSSFDGPKLDLYALACLRGR